MKSVLLSLILCTTLLTANEKQKTEEELIAEFMELDKETKIQESKIKKQKEEIKKSKVKTKELKGLSKTVDKLSKTLGAE